MKEYVIMVLFKGDTEPTKVYCNDTSAIRAKIELSEHLVGHGRIVSEPIELYKPKNIKPLYFAYGFATAVIILSIFI